MIAYTSIVLQKKKKLQCYHTKPETHVLFVIVYECDDSCGWRPRGSICSIYTADKIKRVIRIT